MVLRFFPTFSEEIHNIYDAMKLRGIALSWKNVFTRPVLILEAIAIPIVMRSASIAEELSASGIKPNTIRLSIGLENINDILRDLAQALA